MEGLGAILIPEVLETDDACVPLRLAANDSLLLSMSGDEEAAKLALGRPLDGGASMPARSVG